MFSEQDVDRDLKAALSVSPSPDFEARVRQRIEEDQPSGAFDRLRAGWTARHAWLAAAASVVLAAGLFSVTNRPTAVVEDSATPPVVARPEPRPVPVAVTPPTTKPIERRHVARVRPAAPAARNTEPEVIVPVNQMEAVRRLVDAVNEGRIALLAPSEGPVEPPAEVVVAPIVVEPLPIPALEPDAGPPSPEIRRQ